MTPTATIKITPLQTSPPSPPYPKTPLKTALNPRTCSRFIWSAFRFSPSPSPSPNPPIRTQKTVTLFARLSMWLILLLRLAISLLCILERSFGDHLVTGVVVGILLLVLGFWAVAGCLAVIGAAEGKRRVLGFTWVSCGLSFPLLFLTLMAGQGAD